MLVCVEVGGLTGECAFLANQIRHESEPGRSQSNHDHIPAFCAPTENIGRAERHRTIAGIAERDQA